jgi:hypothetical protein
MLQNAVAILVDVGGYRTRMRTKAPFRPSHQVRCLRRRKYDDAIWVEKRSSTTMLTLRISCGKRPKSEAALAQGQE